MSKFLDIALIVCIFAAVAYTAGRFTGYTEGQIQGYLMGYESFYEKAYIHLRDSLERVRDSLEVDY